MYEELDFDWQRQRVIAAINRPGKFKGCSVADFLLWEWLQGADGETVSFPDGSFDTLIEGSLDELSGPMTYAEHKQLVGCVGAIVTESAKGLIQVFWYHDSSKLGRAWETTKRSAKNAETDPEFGWGGG